MKKAIITGIYGQDGSYLAELLIKKGYEVHGIIKEPLSNLARQIKIHLDNKAVQPVLHNISLYNYEDISKLILELQADECFHLAATHYSSSKTAKERHSIDRILYNNNIISASNLIHSIVKYSPSTNYVQAGSCLMYESTMQSPQNEDTPYSTNSNYGLSKVAAAQLIEVYRQKGFHMSTAILFNHESPRRSQDFVTQKIAHGIAAIKSGAKKFLELANIDSKKDWGYAPDYVNAIWGMAQLETPEDYVLATGELYSVEDFIKEAFFIIGISKWDSYVNINENLAFKTGVSLVGDSKRAYNDLGWKHTLNFKELVAKMVISAIEGHLD